MDSQREPSVWEMSRNSREKETWLTCTKRNKKEAEEEGGEGERGKKALGLSGADLRSLPLDCCSPLLLLSHTSAKAEREREKKRTTIQL